MSRASVMVVDDEPSMRSYLRTLLESENFGVETADSGRSALQQLERGTRPDLLLLDVVMPDMDGLQTLAEIRQRFPGQKVLMLSCLNETNKVVHAMRLGARDYLTKPLQPSELEAALAPHLESPPRIEAEAEVVDDDYSFVSASPAMQKVRALVEQVAAINVPVLLLGESGTGKEVIARLLHRRSPRATRTFLKVNCAAIPSELLESELFGYEAGAFTGASRQKQGKFEQCDKGTIFLDEIGEMPPVLQAKLLQVLQDHEFSRLGGKTTRSVDVRIVAATNIDIPKAIAEKKLREDLYYRLNAFTIQLPPLRERREEIPALMRHFMHSLSAQFNREPLDFSPALMEAALRCDWPGNVRELENFVKRYLVLADDDAALQELRRKLELRLAEGALPASQQPGGLKAMVRNLKDEAEKAAIVQALEETAWSRKEAARRLNISYKALLYKIRDHQLDAA